VQLNVFRLLSFGKTKDFVFMALTKENKSKVIVETKELLENSKLTVLASYSGITVKSLQELRAKSLDSNTNIKVIKNRLFKIAAASNEQWNNVDFSYLTGQIIYAFNPDDEVAPAKTLAEFSSTNPSLLFVGAITQDGQFLSPDDVKAIAVLPNKDQIRAMLVGTISAPLVGFINVLNGSLLGLLNVLSARSENIT
jgi:large subunit ribosomal protein L10